MSRVLRFLGFLGITIAGVFVLWVVGIVLLYMFDKDHLEYEGFDPALHGKTLKLNAEMVYFLATPERSLGASLGDYKKELFPRRSAEGFNTEFVSVNIDTSFIILKSFWTRMGWLSRKMASTENEGRYLVLKDENGEISICSIYFLEKGDVYLDG